MCLNDNVMSVPRPDLLVYAITACPSGSLGSCRKENLPQITNTPTSPSFPIQNETRRPELPSQPADLGV